MIAAFISSTSQKTLSVRLGLIALATGALVTSAKAQSDAVEPKPLPNMGIVSIQPHETSTARKLEIGIGRSVIVELPRDAREVFVADPKVANAVVRSSRRLFIIGLADGATSLFALDGEGKQIAHVEVTIGRDLNILRRLLRTAMPEAKVDVVAVADNIVLNGEVESAEEAARAIDIAKGFVGASYVGASGNGGSAGGGASVTIGGGAVILGKVINGIRIRGKDQVMLKVTVAEVQRTVAKQLGVNLRGQWTVGNFTVTGLSDNPLTNNLSSSSLRAASSSGGYVDLRAYEKAGVLRTLAEPTLTAISGETAKFTAGGEVPIPTASGYTTGPGGAVIPQITFTYKPFGVSLNFSPVVLSAGRISMRVATEVTELSTESQAISNGITVPSIRVRKSDTTVELASGSSLVTAGLIQNTSRQQINGIPGLRSLPILGALFRSREYERNETELMIIVTPFIAKPSSATQLARPDDGFIEASDPHGALLGRLNKVYGVVGAPNTGQRYRGHVGFIAD